MADIDWSERYDRYQRLAGHYADMAQAIERGDDERQRLFPKAIPRGRPAAWYRAKAETYRQKADEAAIREDEQLVVENMIRGMALPPDRRKASEQVEASYTLDWITDMLSKLPLKMHIAVVQRVVEDLQERCAAESVDSPE
jgi:hypothetical protein